MDVPQVSLRCSVIVYRRDAVLVLRRNRDSTEEWVLPGGYLEPGEGIAACARREVHEETGLHVGVERCVFVLETIAPNHGRRTVELVFMGTDEDPDRSPEGVEQGLIPLFVPLDDLDTRALLPPLAGHLRGLHLRLMRDRSTPPAAPYLGNLWRDRPSSSAVEEAAP